MDRLMQCPECGMTLQGDRLGSIIRCSFCGATLEIVSGASGFALARLVARAREVPVLYPDITCTQAIEELRKRADRERGSMTHYAQANLQAVIGEDEDWGSNIRNFAVSPAGDRIAVYLSDGIGHREENVLICDLKGRRLLSFRNSNGGEQGLAFWSDSLHLLTPGCNPGGLKLWDLSGKPEFSHFLADTPLTNIMVTLWAASPSGRYVIGKPGSGAGGYGYGAICVDTAQGNRWLPAPVAGATRYLFSGTERYLARYSIHHDPIVIDLENNHTVHKSGFSEGSFLCFGKKGDWFFACKPEYSPSCSEPMMRIETRDLQTMEVIRSQTRRRLWIRRAALSADESLLAVYDLEGNIRLWDADDLSELLCFPTGLQDISLLLFSQRGDELIALEHSWERPNRVCVWKLR